MTGKIVHKHNRSNTETMLDKYVEKMAEILKPTPMPTYEPIKVKPIRFSNIATVSVNALAADILTVLEGHTIEDIVAASNVAEQFVKAQSKGQYYTYSPVGGV
jgi:hypothetical protein